MLLEQNDEWAVQRACYNDLETIAPLSTRRELASVGGLTDSALPEVTKTRCDRGH